MEDAEGGVKFNESHDGGPDCNIATVTVLERDDQEGGMWHHCDRCCNVEECKEGHREWIGQFSAAFYVDGSPEDQADASATDWVLHIISLPWKLFFALVPPPVYCGGWLCF